MATLDEIGQEKLRISERLARLDAERTKLGDQLNRVALPAPDGVAFGSPPSLGFISSSRSPQACRGNPSRLGVGNKAPLPPAGGGRRGERVK
jgi:hypothetical protein